MNEYSCIVTIRVLVTGGRAYPNRAVVARMLAHIQTLFPGISPGEFVLVHGDCKYRRADGTIDYDRSADQLAAQEADRLGWQIEAHEVTREAYARHGRPAPRLRNEHMVALGAHICAAFPGGQGTKHCRETAEAAGIPVLTVAGLP